MAANYNIGYLIGVFSDRDPDDLGTEHLKFLKQQKKRVPDTRDFYIERFFIKTLIELEKLRVNIAKIGNASNSKIERLKAKIEEDKNFGFDVEAGTDDDKIKLYRDIIIEQERQLKQLANKYLPKSERPRANSSKGASNSYNANLHRAAVRSIGPPPSIAAKHRAYQLSLGPHSNANNANLHRGYELSLGPPPPNNNRTPGVFNWARSSTSRNRPGRTTSRNRQRRSTSRNRQRTPRRSTNRNLIAE
jgi:hypothetical protein